VQDGVPIHLYTHDIDDRTREQLLNLARSPMPVGYVSAMPDVHLGKGATIGSVFASRDLICPNAVGVDIGCGMCAVPVFHLKRGDLSDKKLLQIQRGIRSAIPTGFDSHDKATKEAANALQSLVRDHQPTKWVRNRLADKHARQLGTLGGGNHFVELVYDEDDRVWMMLHSGSRNIGNVTAQHYDGVAAEQCDGQTEALAYLRVSSDAGQSYIKDMLFCQAYAFANRQFMLRAFSRVVQNVTKKRAAWDDAVNIHHNYCECEVCRYQDPATGEVREEELWVTRKGATSARKGQLGIIPGSMGTGSYIVRGRGESESWNSCSHGAGRQLSRKQAFRVLDSSDFADHMRREGVLWDREHAERVKDEAPMAYKDLSVVMQNQEDLVEVVHHLRPLINMKGW